MTRYQSAFAVPSGFAVSAGRSAKAGRRGDATRSLLEVPGAVAAPKKALPARGVHDRAA